VELYARVRRAVLVDGMSRRAAAREFGLARKTVHKMLEFSVPPGYQRQKPVRRPKLGPWQGVIDAILEDDKQRPRKQSGSPASDLCLLGWNGTRPSGSSSGFAPLSHAPGEAQADFGEALVVIAGVEQKAHFMAFDLPHSDDCFVQAFPAETTEAFLPPQRRRPVAGDPVRSPRPRHRVFWRRSDADSLRQHQTGGSADPGRRPTAEDTSLFRVTKSLSFCR